MAINTVSLVESCDRAANPAAEVGGIYMLLNGANTDSGRLYLCYITARGDRRLICLQDGNRWADSSTYGNGNFRRVYGTITVSTKER